MSSAKQRPFCLGGDELIAIVHMFYKAFIHCVVIPTSNRKWILHGIGARIESCITQRDE